MLKQISTGLFVIMTIIGIGSCEHKPKELVNPNNGGGTNDTTKPTVKCHPDTAYFNEISPILNQYCAQKTCHDGITKTKGINYTTYKSITQTGRFVKYYPTQGDGMEKILNGEMPPPGYPNLTQTQIDLISKWIKQGMKNNYCSSACDSTVSPYYTTSIKAMIDNNCIACHSSGPVLLNSYASVKSHIDDGRIWGAINHTVGFKPMPSLDIKLSECEIATFKKWAVAGSPEKP